MRDAPLGPRADRAFFACMGTLAGAYALLIAAMLFADARFTTLDSLRSAWAEPEIRYSIRLSLLTCTLSALISLWIAVPTGYLLARTRFPGRALLDALFDVPIVLPPMVVGISLLILFQTGPGQAVEGLIPVTYRVPSIIIAQVAVSAAFAIRTMRVTFETIGSRREQVAWTLGCTRAQGFFRIALPEAGRGVLAAGILAWARALGEFGPILVFSGATRMHTEVLPTTIFLELSAGRLEVAVAVSLILVTLAAAVLLVTRLLGVRIHGAAL